MSSLTDLEDKVRAGDALTRSDAERVRSCPDLVSVGALAEIVRKAMHGDRVTFGRVCEVGPTGVPIERGEAGEVRLTGAPTSIAEARMRVRAAAGVASGVPLTGFSIEDLLVIVNGDHLALADLALTLKHEGLDGVAEVPLDRLGDTENAVEVVRAVLRGGLMAPRATVLRAPSNDRLDQIERAATIHRETGAFRAFAPLPRLDPSERPSTGYDDVRTVAVARLMCRQIPSIQVDWPLYGPKLAQVAIVYGADDIDGIAAVDTLGLGVRRAPREDIERQIRAAFAEPAERDGRYETRV
jgi:aminodeoxyfutalosine synthase